jgi:WD40 repeat protein
MGHHLHAAPAPARFELPILGIPRSLANAGTHARWQRAGKRNCWLLSSPHARYCRRHFVESGPGDPNAPTRTVLPGGSDAATDEGGDPDRTRSSADQTHASVAGTPRSGADKARRPAPLQYRDPERYEVIAEHGRGGLGRVMRARDKELGRPVAIKEMLHPGLTSELRFFREALITARLEHPGIVPVHEAGRWPDGTPFYAMKLVAGRPLKAVIEDATTLDARLALLPHVVAVCDAIAYAHSRGIIHRDLKPSNVIVGDFGETVVIDWGLAKDVAEPDDPASPATTPAAPGLTIAGTVLGTPGYMSPEQAAGTADTRSDIFAIGALLSHVLHGQPPVGASGAPPAPPAARPSAKVPAALQAIVAMATAADPSQRYSAARALGDDLRQYQSGKLVTAHRYSLAQLIHHWATRNKRLLAVSLVAAVVLVATIGVSASRIVRERGEAVTARAVAEAQRQELILAQARHDLNVDPSRALLWLQAYRGDDQRGPQSIAGEALARGVSAYVLNGKASHLSLIEPASDTTFFSLGAGSALRRWTLSGRGATNDVATTDFSDQVVLDYAPRARRMVRTSNNGEIVVDDGVAIRSVLQTSGKPRQLTISEDGSRILIVDGAGRLAISSIDGSADTTLIERSAEVAACRFVDGNRVSIVFANGGAEEIDLATQKSRRLMIPAAAFADVAKSGHIVTLSDSGDLTVVSPGLTSPTRFAVAAVCRQMMVSPRGDLVALRCGERLLMISLSTGAVMLDYPQSQPTMTWAFSDDGEWLASSSLDGRLLLVSTRTWSTQRLLGHAAVVHSALAFVGENLVSGDELGQIRVWQLPDHQSMVSLPKGDVRRVAASPDGKWFATDSSLGIVRLWDSDGRLQREYRGHKSIIPSVTFSADSRYALTPGWDGKLGVWPTGPGSTGRLLDAGPEEVVSVVASDDGAITASDDGAVRVWNLETGASTLLTGVPAEPYFVTTTGSLVAAGGKTGAVHQFDRDSGTFSLVTQFGHPLSALRYSPDGRWLVSSDEGGTVRVAANATRGMVAQVETNSPVVAIAISYDSTLLAIATQDRVLQILTLPQMEVLQVHSAHVKRMTFARSRNALAAACHDGTARVWHFGEIESVEVVAVGDDPIGVALTPDAGKLAVTRRYGLSIIDLGRNQIGPGRTALLSRITSALTSYQRPRSLPPEQKDLPYAEE